MTPMPWVEAGRERLLLLAPVEHVVAHLRDVDAAGAQALGHHRAGEVRHARRSGRARRPPPPRARAWSPRTACRRPASERAARRPSRCAGASGSRRPRAGCWPRLESRSGPSWPGGGGFTPHLVTRMTSRRRVLERARHHLLGVAGPVGRRGVHAVHAAVERAVDGLDGLVVLDRAVAVAGHRPAAEAQHRYLAARSARTRGSASGYAVAALRSSS